MAIEIGSGVQFGSGTQIHTSANPISTGLVLHLDAATLGANPSTWIDSVSSLTFTLYGSPVYSSSNGGYLSFAPGSGQYAQSPNQSFGSLSTWSVEVWHYYEGTNTGIAPCIVTELYPNVTNNINFSLGSNVYGSTNLQAGFWNSNWRTTPVGYSLTSGSWYHIMGTYDGTTLRLYVNDTLAQTESYSNTPVSGGSGIRLMRRWDDADYWGGRLAIVRIYSTALSAEDVSTNYSADRHRFGL